MAAQETSPYDNLISELLERATPVERCQFLDEHPQAFSREFLAALKAHADRLEQQEPQQAVYLGEVAAEVAEQMADDVARALALIVRANAGRALGQYQQAVVLYQEAAAVYAATGDELAAAMARVGQVDALAGLGQTEEALRVAEAIGATLDAHGASLARAKLDMNLGVLHARLGQPEVALVHYVAARTAFAGLGDPIRVAMLDANRANVLTDLDSFREAEALYTSARQGLAEGGLDSAAAQVDQCVAYLLFAQGQFDLALRLFDRARQAFIQTGQPVAVADVELDQSQVYLRLNLLDEAWAACERAEPVFRQQGHMAQVGHILLNRALVQLGRERWPECAALLAEAAQIFGSQGNPLWQALAHLNQAVYLLRLERPAEALVAAQTAARLFGEGGLRTRQCLALTLAGEAWQALDYPGAAEASYRAALGAVEGLAAPWLTYRVHHGLGRVYQGQGARQAAYQAYRQAVADLEHMQSSFGIEPHRIAYLQDKLAPYEDLILFCLEDGEPERAGEAFDYVERAKSRALVDLLTRNLSGRVEPHDEAGQRLIGDLERLRQELNWYYNRINDADRDAPQRSPVLVARAWQEISRLESQADELMGQLRVRYTDYLSLRQVQTPSLGAIRACLPPHGLLVEFYMARGATMAFTLSQESLRVYRGLMEPEAIRRWLEVLRFQINKFRYGAEYLERHGGTLRAGVDRCLAGLYRGLLGPLADELDGRPLVIVPHGMLHYVPFHALHDGQGYLLERHRIYTAPSASVLHLCCSQPRDGAGPALLLGVADPAIPHVLEEISAIGHTLDRASLFTGPQASLERVRAEAPASGLIHIASHALFRADNPIFSALRLADGWLNVNDIYALQLKARLVTLSGCETGIARVANGDELIGLSRAFFYAGAPALVVSLWAVHDESTAGLMRRFYQGLQAGQGVAEALRQAQLDLMQEYAHPYYWASFSAIGDGRAELADAAQATPIL